MRSSLEAHVILAGLTGRRAPRSADSGFRGRLSTAETNAICLDRRPMFVLYSHGWIVARCLKRRRTAASASKKGEPKDRLETGWSRRRRRNEGLAPVREMRLETRSGQGSGRYFPAAGAFRPAWPRPSAQRAEDSGRAPSDPAISRLAAERLRLKEARKNDPARLSAPALRLLPRRRKTETEKQSPPYPPCKAGRRLEDFRSPSRGRTFGAGWGVARLLRRVRGLITLLICYFVPCNYPLSPSLAVNQRSAARHYG